MWQLFLWLSHWDEARMLARKTRHVFDLLRLLHVLTEEKLTLEVAASKFFFPPHMCTLSNIEVKWWPDSVHQQIIPELQ